MRQQRFLSLLRPAVRWRVRRSRAPVSTRHGGDPRNRPAFVLPVAMHSCRCGVLPVSGIAPRRRASAPVDETCSKISSLTTATVLTFSATAAFGHDSLMKSAHTDERSNGPIFNSEQSRPRPSIPGVGQNFVKAVRTSRYLSLGRGPLAGQLCCHPALIGSKSRFR